MKASFRSALVAVFVAYGTSGCGDDSNSVAASAQADATASTDTAGANVDGNTAGGDAGKDSSSGATDVTVADLAVKPEDAAADIGVDFISPPADVQTSPDAAQDTAEDTGPQCVVDSDCQIETGACNVAVCVAGKCTVAPGPDGVACTPSGTCLDAGTCAAGQCQGKTKTCDDGDLCTTDSCDSNNGACIHAPVAGCGKTGCKADSECDDKNACTTDTCDLASGACANQPQNDGAPCDDGNLCTGSEACKAGTCVGVIVPCNDGDPCTLDGCDAKTGACSATAQADGSPCDDGNGCTTGELCKTNKCVGTATVCSDGDPCTEDACDATTGKCTATDIAGCGGKCKASADCDDKNPCTDDVCDKAGGTCKFSGVDGKACDDLNPCTEKEACLAGVCAGTAIGCDDGNPCTAEACDKPTGKCAGTFADGTTCDDKNPCSDKDTCKAGACAGSAKVCDDKDPCTNDACDQATGACKTEAIAGCGGNCKLVTDCDDKNSCTDDACTAGKCVNKYADAKVCDDSDACTVGDACLSGKCVPGKATTCTDNNACTVDTCDATTGKCGSVAIGDGAACSDNNACTLADQCKAGVCTPGSKAICDDGNPCTTDSCDSATGKCGTKPLADGVACTDKDGCTSGDACKAGTCTGTPVACSDGDPCTTDVCAGGKCQFKGIANCGAACKVDADCNDKNACTTDSCVNGQCIQKPQAGGACNDNNQCTVGDTCAVVGQAGLCQGKAVVCDDKNPCTVDACDKANGACLSSPVATNTPCDDGNSCTLGDACKLGVCGGTSNVACDDGNACTADACDKTTGKCISAPIAGCGSDCLANADCDDKNPCTTDTCKLGKCAIANNDGAPCSDGDACTAGELCALGKCTPGKPVVCDDKNPCTVDACDKATGKCGATAAKDGSACTDGNGCTQNDACKAGVCSGAALVCFDNDPCTVDVCVPTTGKCAFNGIPKCGKNCATDADCGGKDVCFTPACVSGQCQNKPLSGTPCGDGNPCTTTDTCNLGVCAGKPMVCDDGNPCTSDACDKGKCVTGGGQSGTPCTDKNLCTTADVCKGGICAGTPNNCNDADPCTLDKCDAGTGACSHTAIANCGNPCKVNTDCNDANVCTVDICAASKCAYSGGGGVIPCDDGNLCTVGDTCKGGTCQPGGVQTCDDKNACTTDACDAKTGKCSNVNGADGAACEDGNPCTQNDACKIGLCVPGALVVCNDSDVCTMDACLPQTGKCVFVDIPGCGNKCKTAADCKPTGVQCAEPACIALKCFVAATPGKACNDNNPCTSNDVCGPTCFGTPTICNDNDPCTTDSCDVKSGCVYQKIANCGAKCKTNPDCDDKDACTFDVCNPANGNCIYTKIPGCIANPQCKLQTDCDDSDACTADFCNIATGLCQHVAIPGCVGTPTCKTNADCDDKNKCTQDFCNTFTGKCLNVALPGCTP